MASRRNEKKNTSDGRPLKTSSAWSKIPTRVDPSHHPLSRFILFLRVHEKKGKHKNSSQDFLQHCNVPENYYFTRARKKDPFMICPAAVKSRRRFFNRSQPFPFFSVLTYATLLEIFSLAMEETPKPITNRYVKGAFTCF